MLRPLPHIIASLRFPPAGLSLVLPFLHLFSPDSVHFPWFDFNLPPMCFFYIRFITVTPFGPRGSGRCPRRATAKLTGREAVEPARWLAEKWHLFPLLIQLARRAIPDDLHTGSIPTRRLRTGIAGSLVAVLQSKPTPTINRTSAAQPGARLLCSCAADQQPSPLVSFPHFEI